MGKLLESLQAETRPVATPATPATQRRPDAQTGPKGSRVARVAEANNSEHALLARCREACRGLPLWPAELLSALTEDDKAAHLSNDEGPEVLRAFAESLACRLRTRTLPKGLHEVYERLRAELAANPGLKFASETLDPDSDPVLIAIAVRGAGFATLRIAPEKYDAGRLIQIVQRQGESK